MDRSPRPSAARRELRAITVDQMPKAILSTSHSRRQLAESHAARPALPGMARVALVMFALLAALLWCYWGVLVSLYRDWQADDNYSVGQLVPLIAAYLLWHDREKLRRCTVRTCWWGGLVIAAALLMRALGLIFFFESA